MPTAPQHSQDHRRGFWGADSVIGLLLLLPFAFALVFCMPSPVRHGRAKAIVRGKSQVEFEEFDLRIWPASVTPDADPTGLEVQLLDGAKGWVHVYLDCAVYWYSEFLVIVVAHTVHGPDGQTPRMITVKHTDVELVDSNGFRFTVGPPQARPSGPGVALPVDESQALEHIKFGDPDYFLALKVPFSFARGSPMVISVDRLDPFIDPRIPIGDSLGHAIETLLVVAMLIICPVAALILLARAARRWRQAHSQNGE